MSMTDDFRLAAGFTPEAPAAPTAPATPVASPKRVLHRLAEVRREQGVSERSMVRRLGLSTDQVRRQEAATTDLKLSELYAWQAALEVPVADLLVEQSAPLSRPVLDRARMLRVMKTIRAIKESGPDTSMMRMIQMLESQLLEAMPELDEVTPWHTVGQRRTHEEMGRIAERPVSQDFANDGLL